MASIYSRLQMRAFVSGMPITLHARLWQARCSLCSLCQRPVVTSMGIAQRQWHSARLAATALAADTGTSHTSPSGALAFSKAPTVSAQDPLPDQPGVYAVFDAQGVLQYVGLSRKLSASIRMHLQQLPTLVSSVRYTTPGEATREILIGLWKDWMQQAASETGAIPPGNMKDNDTWTSKRSAARPEIRLTPGKGLQDLTCSVTDLVDQVVKSSKVVAFIKGTRNAPECGFSYRVLSLLNEVGGEYDVVNVLDEVHNPGLREAIKEYSEWPTIPQVFVKGEFVGGADILQSMHESGELRKQLE